MADVILFHHAQGLTDGVRSFADDLRSAGHRVTVPDLFEGATFPTVEEGVAYAESVGFENIIARGEAAADAAGLPAASVYAGFSMGTLPAEKLALTRPGALAVLLYHDSGQPPAMHGASAWPAGVALQIHVHRDDPWIDGVDIAESLVAEAAKVADAELFVYDGSTHLFADDSLPDHDPPAAAQLLTRTLDLLARWP